MVDGEADIVRLLEQALGGAGLDTSSAADGRTALRLAAEQRPNLILTELVLPELSGLELCSAIRQNPLIRSTALLFVTSRTAEADRVRAFESGADDYVVKPFSVRELTLRCEALLRTARPRRVESAAPPPQPLCWGPIEVDPGSSSCSVYGRPVRLTPLELRLLANLLGGGSRLLTHEQLLAVAWDLPRPLAGAKQHLLVNRLRKKLELLRRKLGPAGACLQTVRGRGYRLAMPIG